MRKLSLSWILISAVLLLLGAPGTASAGGAPPPGLLEKAAGPAIPHADRTVLYRDVVHYRWNVTVGSGPHDVIRLHRFVREPRPYVPVRTKDAVLMLPGAPNSVEMIFVEPLISAVPPRDQAITIYLASHDIDVFAMDYAWALVPPETSDFGFMKDWGLAKDAQHAEIALGLARLIRGATGQGLGPLNLLGLSYGVFVGYAVTGEETRVRPPALRNVKGFVTVDTALKVEDADARAVACQLVSQVEAQLGAGIWADNSGVFLKQLADLAVSAPNDPSPVPDFAGLTNLQVTFLLGASPNPPVSWHFVGTIFDDQGLPTGLRFTDASLWVDVLRAVPPYEPMLQNAEIYRLWCDQAPVPGFAHFRDVAVPIFYVGAAGGFGRSGLYTPTLTASRDVEHQIVQLLPDDQRAFDFGHADTMTATNADDLVWKPILDWILKHR